MTLINKQMKGEFQMVNKYMKICLISLTIKEIKSRLLSHLISVRTSVSRKQTEPKTDKYVRKKPMLILKAKNRTAMRLGQTISWCLSAGI